jgi:hypothetical protein
VNVPPAIPVVNVPVVPETVDENVPVVPETAPEAATAPVTETPVAVALNL